jgi:HTH DNA binding domain
MLEETVEALRDQVRVLQGTLNQDNQALTSTFKLTPLLGNLLGLLMAKPVVSCDMIVGVLKTTPKVAAHRLKKELIPWGITIHNKRRVGWWLDAVTKESINGLVERLP